MDREIQFDKNAICDGCGHKGAFDFMGDYYCQKCIEKFYDTDECFEDCDYYLEYSDDISGDIDDVDDDDNVDHTDDLNE